MWESQIQDVAPVFPPSCGAGGTIKKRTAIDWHIVSGRRGEEPPGAGGGGGTDPDKREENVYKLPSRHASLDFRRCRSFCRGLQHRGEDGRLRRRLEKVVEIRRRPVYLSPQPRKTEGGKRKMKMMKKRRSIRTRRRRRKWRRKKKMRMRKRRRKII